MKPLLHALLTCTILTTAATLCGAADLPQIILPKHRLQASDLAIIVNDADPLSRQIANYYQQRRGIPPANLIHISFAPGRSALSAVEFVALKQQVDAATPATIQAYALTWAAPYRVECMSITSAFALGFDKRYCSAKTCALTQPTAYFASDSTAPFTDFKIRPTMAIAAKDFSAAKQLIDRGIASDGSRPKGTAYLVSTTDKARNARAPAFALIKKVFSPFLNTEVVRLNTLLDREDVLFYFTGLAQVKGINTLTYLPGAVADHLTSTGGKLTDSGQMSALRWLEAGATGSYGTVVEPCAHTGKFPNPGLLMQHYVQGETLIEAYWKSVQMPGEGIFIGEPLAAPFDFQDIERQPDQIVVRTWSIKPGVYQLQHAPTTVGPYQPLLNYQIGFPLDALRIPDRGAAVYRMMPLRAPRPVQ
ncbi:MAG TPA: TIGR03790 family protein [Gammaproteobacteria bacterium]|nr:TIGR03790 family protein [Gammaproteobacteria bacterium]